MVEMVAETEQGKNNLTGVSGGNEIAIRPK